MFWLRNNKKNDSAFESRGIVITVNNSRLLTLGDFSCFLPSADFCFKINLLEKIFQESYLSVKHIGPSLCPKCLHKLSADDARRLLPVYRYMYSVNCFSYSGPLGLLGSDGKQNMFYFKNK